MKNIPYSNILRIATVALLAFIAFKPKDTGDTVKIDAMYERLIQAEKDRNADQQRAANERINWLQERDSLLLIKQKSNTKYIYETIPAKYNDAGRDELRRAADEY